MEDIQLGETEYNEKDRHLFQRCWYLHQEKNEIEEIEWGEQKAVLRTWMILSINSNTFCEGIYVSIYSDYM